jgi:hypothetical protein
MPCTRDEALCVNWRRNEIEEVMCDVRRDTAIIDCGRG